MDLEQKRLWMVERQLAGRDIKDKRVLDAFREIRREDFVLAKNIGESYDDCPLPIGEGQTISQPYIVALMLQLLSLEGGESVLELGTGSGYQTALLAALGARIYSVERSEKLLARARARLESAGFSEISFLADDGTLGWQEHAPYDRIIVSAAAPGVPQPLKEQLADGGVIVIPLGPRLAQRLTVMSRKGDKFVSRGYTGCAFVPLVGKYGFAPDDW